MTNLKFDHKEAEKKWQAVWKEEKTYSPDVINAKKPYYNLMMFPYPSAEGLHVGNMYAFTGADVYGRYQRMNGYDVLEPIGLDGFGIHSENYAIKVGRHPKEHAKISEKHFYDQLHKIGDSYDWNRTLETYDPNYYKWTQWLFIKMFKAGLAYKDSAMVNWCPSCKTVLADEQVVEANCERCGSIVERREMSSWFFRITKYADRLLSNIEKIKWPEKIKIAQRQWIGKKDGINITYNIKDQNEKVTVFTTAPVNFGATFIVVAPEYAEKNLLKIVPKSYAKEVNAYIKLSLSKSEQQRKEDAKDKSGVFTGLYAINHVTKKEIPIWITDFVLMNVGTGAVQGCPGHDLRDFEFAKKFKLPIIRVVVGEDGDNSEIEEIDQVVEHGMKGKFVNSDFLNGMEFEDGLQKTMNYFEEKGWGKRISNYHLRDWLISRQRYWGPPIPMIYCENCAKENKFLSTPLNSSNKSMAGWYPVPESDLPILLPDVADFTPKGDGTSPLHNALDSWKRVKCPKCHGDADRELDVSDTFLDSSWYFLAYPNLGTPEWKGTDLPLNPEITKKWFPVNAYIGGAEHAVLHLLYARFVTMFLKDQGYVDFEEPFPFLFGHGLIIRDGAKMSKSKGNIVNPDAYIEKFGADTLRTYLMFLGPYDQGGDFRDTGIEGMERFLNRVYRLFDNYKVDKNDKSTLETLVSMHKTINFVSTDISNFKYNTALAKIMEYVNYLTVSKVQSSEALEVLLKLLAPFAPHMTEELYQKYFAGNDKLPNFANDVAKTMPVKKASLGGQITNDKTENGKRFNSIHTSQWPQYISKYLKEDQITIVVQVNGKLRSQLTIDSQKAKIKEEVISFAKADSKVLPWIEGKKIIKEIFVPDKLVNFVV